MLEPHHWWRTALVSSCAVLCMVAGRAAAQVNVTTVFLSATENPAEPTLNRRGEVAYGVAAPIAAARIEVNGSPVVSVGDPVLPIAGASWSTLSMGAFGDAGHLVVSGFLDGADPGEDFAAVIYGGGGPVPLYQIGVTAAPGTEAGTTFGGGGAERIPTASRLALRTYLAGPDVDCDLSSPGYNCEGIWVGDPGALIKTARAGEAAVGISQAVFKRFGNDEHRNPLAFNSNGELAFVARLSGTAIGASNDTAVYRGSAGSVALVAWEGQPAPGGGFYDEIREPSIGPSGGVAFLAGSAVYLDGERIAQVGDPAPRGGSIVAVSFPAIHHRFVFRAEVLDGGSLLDSYMMLVDDELVEVVREGDVAPDTGGQTFTMLASNAVVNECGQIPFQGRLADGRDGLWIYHREGVGVLVALEGEPSPQGPDYLSFLGYLGDRGARANLSDGGHRYFNNAGKLVFRASLVNGSLGVFLSDPPGLPCDPTFADGFESGDTSAWSATVP